jgi:diguanylate cyclase (GGDEF)-like protein/PAS domain S-box-containing protein
MFGYGDGVSIAATPVSQHVATRARDDFRARQEARPRGRPLGEAFETIGLRRDGTEFPLLVQARQIDLSDGPATLGFFLDLSEQRAAEEELRTSEERFRALVQHASDVIVMADVDSRARYVSPSAERMLRREPASLIDQLLTDLLHPEDAPAALAALADVAASVGSTAHAEWRLLRSDGSYCETETTISNMLDIAGVGGIVFTCRDIGERKELERQLTLQALHDPLTGLANRSLFNDRLEQALKRSRRSREEVAVLFIDLDDFKRINDSHGHAIGDSLLVEAGSRVRATLRAGDTAARLGGDEFAVLLEDLDDPATAHEVAERVAAVLHMPYALDGLEAFVTASVGIAVGRRGSIRGPELLRDADVAMYVAKAKGKRRCELFRPSMHEEVRDRLLLEAELRHAVERNEFEVYYQPVWATATRAMIGVEALVRWRHPERGIVAPAGFIAVAEETGLIVPIGSFVLHAACAQAVAWDQSGVTAGLSVAVNLSPRQLREPNLLPMIKGELTASGMAPERLNLEITESLLVDDDQVIVDLLDGLKSLGVRISIDDFGTGYSSLSYLRRLPVDTLKIAKSFVDVLSDGTRDEALAQAVIALARSLHLDVVAEGIEHEIQLQILTSMGCPMGQGYLVSPPLPAAQFAELAAESAKDAAA